MRGILEYRNPNGYSGSVWRAVIQTSRTLLLCKILLSCHEFYKTVLVSKYSSVHRIPPQAPPQIRSGPFVPQKIMTIQYWTRNHNQQDSSAIFVYANEIVSRNNVRSVFVIATRFWPPSGVCTLLTDREQHR